MNDMQNQAEVAWIPGDDEFGARLALVRWRMGWNAKEAALACDLPQNSWRGWEVAGHLPRNVVEVVAKISARTGVDEYWLLTGKKNPRQGGPDGGLGLPRLDSNQQPSGYPEDQVSDDAVDELAARRERYGGAGAAPEEQAPCAPAAA